MRIKFLFCLLFCLSFHVVIANAKNTDNVLEQQQGKTTIVGKVVDEDGEAIIGASIVLPKSKGGTVTNLEGEFTVNASANDDLLEISFLGYVTQRIKLSGQTNIFVKLIEDSKALDEIVVVGYGTMDKKELTSAVSHISSKDFLNVSSIDPAMQIQGKVAGVSITNTETGNPNSTASIQIRGISSRNAGLGPLIVVDGVPGGNLQNINSNDIQSIDVLKDGAASAIYGTRGSNGVIIITTKKGPMDGRVSTQYNGYVSFDVIANTLDVLSADEYRQYKVGDGKFGTDYGTNTDWMKEITQTGITQNHSLTLAGGNQKSNFRLSLDARDATGIDLRSDRLEYGARLSFEHTTNSGLFKFFGNVAPRVVQKNNSDKDVFKQALTANPTMSVKDQTDASGKKYSYFNGDGMWNPVERLKTVKDYDELKFLDWNLSARLNILPLLAKDKISDQALSTTITVSQQHYDDHYFYFKPSYNTEMINSGIKGEAKQELKTDRNESLEWIMNYTLDRNDHSLGLMGGYSYQEFMHYEYMAENKDFPSDAITWDNLGDGTYMKKDGRNGMDSNRKSSKLIGFFGRATYNYKLRYMLTASLRYEGSSKFGTNNKWGYFPAVSAGWRMSDESFMKGITWLNNLKVRADLGVTGNQDFDPYKSLPTYAGYGDTFYNGQYYQGWGSQKNPNPNLKWEKAINWNIGLDFALFDKVSGSFNYYNRKQQDLLGDYKVGLPPYQWDKMYANVGTMRNTGFEFDINVEAVRTKDFSYNVGFVGATNNNKFLSFSNDDFQGQSYYDVCGMEAPGSPGNLQRIEEGERVGNYRTWRYAGVDDKGNWLVYNKDNEVIPIGNAVDEDKAITGNGLPQFTASLNNTFIYKNFDLSLYFRGAFGYDIFNAQDFYWALQGVYGPYNVQKKAFTDNAAVTSGQNQLVDYFIEKGDYVKLDLISLGYTWNLNNPWLEKIRLYGTVKNVFTITGFSGVDPAQYPTNGLTPGTNNGNKTYYPSTTQFLLGAQISF